MSFSWQSVAKTFIYVSFKKNQKSLSKTVCVNKDKPKSCCQAKCYLEKEIKKEDSRQSNLPSGLKDKTEKTELLSTYLSFDFLPIITSKEYNGYQVSSELKQFSTEIFQPPQGVSVSIY